MGLIDADSHFMEPIDWISRTDSDLAAQIPNAMTPEEFAARVLSEVLAVIPEERRPGLRDLLSPGFRRRAEELGPADEPIQLSELEKRIAGSSMGQDLYPKGAHDARGRLEVCDELGIDTQLVNPTLAIGDIAAARHRQPELVARIARTYNTWATEALRESAGRLVPITYIELADVPGAVAELRRVRAAGSRAFVFSLDPVAGRPLGDRVYDPVWATAVDLGMIPIIHVGNGRFGIDPVWATLDGQVNPTALLRMSQAHGGVLAQLALSSIVYGGVFDRFPGLVVLVEEFGLRWVDAWLDTLGPLKRNGSPNFGAWFGWDLKRSPEEYLRENLRFSPLVGQRVDELVDVLGPDVVVFATDYPHPEGSLEAHAYFAQQLAHFDERTRMRFFSGTMQDLLARGA